jgi:hypothetical protein
MRQSITPSAVKSQVVLAKCSQTEALQSSDDRTDLVQLRPGPIHAVTIIYFSQPLGLKYSKECPFFALVRLR